jgi:HTH-type transcriptional regulator/antitoxin HigA
MATMSTYETLLLDYRPRPIRSKAAYSQALRQVEQLMSRPSLGRAESEIVELLSLLIEQYESKDHPTPASTPAEVLEHLIEVRGITQAQLARDASLPRSVITNVLAGRRAISKANAVKLAKYFGISLSLLVEGS